jgi:hypothetical protein
MSEVYKTVVTGKIFSGVTTKNVFYHFASSPDNDGQSVADLTDFASELFTALKPALSDFWNTTNVEVYRWDTVATPQWWQRIGGNDLIVQGENTVDALPTQMAYVIVAHTLGKRSFARKFFAGPHDDCVVENRVVAGTLAVLANTAFLWISNYVGATSVLYQPGLWRKTNEFAGFIDFVVDDLLGTMRRRKAGVGI